MTGKTNNLANEARAKAMQDFWNKHTPGKIWADKKWLSENHTQFHIHKVETGTGKFGSQWLVRCTFDTESGVEYLAGNGLDDAEQWLSFKREMSEVRDTFFEDLGRLLDNFGAILVTLESFETTSGQTAYSLAPVLEV